MAKSLCDAPFKHVVRHVCYQGELNILIFGDVGVRDQAVRDPLLNCDVATMKALQKSDLAWMRADTLRSLKHLRAAGLRCLRCAFWAL